VDNDPTAYGTVTTDRGCLFGSFNPELLGIGFNWRKIEAQST